LFRLESSLSLFVTSVLSAKPIEVEIEEIFKPSKQKENKSKESVSNSDTSVVRK